MFLLTLSCAPKHLPPVAETPQVRLEAGSAPGWVALRWTLEPGWHVYWLNPGDSGMATSVEARAPAGVSLGEPRFPGPQRFSSPGDIESFGYSEELVVLIAAEGASPEPVELLASWLVCREECHFQDARLLVELDGELDLSEHVQALPGSVEAVREGEGWRLPGQELFPSSELGLHGSWTVGDEGIVLSLQQPVEQAWGLVRTGRRYDRFELEAP
jgi:hypothetical protein